MFNLIGKSKVVYSFATILLLINCLAEAAIIRSGGGTKGQDSFNATVLLVDEASINNIGFGGGAVYSSYSYNSYADYVYATPALSCHYDTFFEPFSNNEIRTDCDYEFYIGERLQLEGYIEIFLAGSESYDLLWTISQGAKSWSYSNADILMVDTAQSTNKHLFLDVAMPLDMLVGNYNVELQFAQYAPVDKTYFRYSQYLDQEQCAVLGDVGTPETCGLTGSAWNVLRETSNVEQLRILAVSVSEPSTWILFLLVSVGLIRRQYFIGSKY
jgi:hypothetical protein